MIPTDTLVVMVSALQAKRLERRGEDRSVTINEDMGPLRC
jgi:hypothetical protein